MPRERVIGPAPGSSMRCAIDGCPLPPGAGQRCFIHDRLSGELSDEATRAIVLLDPFFRCAEQLANASPGDSIPSKTRQALKQRCEGLTMSSGMTARQCAQALRAWLLKRCRPALQPSMTIAERMLADGLTPIAELLPHE